MSTRKLIALALGCALVILLAGGIQLVLLSERDTARVEALAAGQSAEVGKLRIAVLSTEVTPGALRVKATLSGPGDLTALAKDHFGVRARERLLTVGAESACHTEGTDAVCDLLFDPGTTNLTDSFVVYRGAEASWAVGPVK
jgi:hypothetical protein